MKKIFQKSAPLMLGAFLSNLSCSMAIFLISWWVLQKTNSSLATGISLATAVVPMIIMSPIGGGLADSKWQKSILVFPDVLSYLFLLFVSLSLFFFDPRYEWSYLWTIMIMSFSALGNPIVCKLAGQVPKETMVKTLSYTNTCLRMGTIFGPLVAGMFIAYFSIKTLLMISCWILCLAAVCKAVYKIPNDFNVKGENFSKPREKWIKKIKNIFGLYPSLIKMVFIFGLMNFFLMPISLIIQLLAKNVYNTQAHSLALLEAVIIFGSILGTWLPSRSFFNKKYNPISLVLLSLGLLNFPLFLLSFLLNFYFTLTQLFILGLLSAFCSTYFLIWAHKEIASEHKGQAFGLLTAFATALGPLGYLFIGTWIEIKSLSSGLFFCASGFFLTFILALFFLLKRKTLVLRQINFFSQD